MRDYETLGCFKGIGVGKIYPNYKPLMRWLNALLKQSFMHKNILSSSAETKSYLQNDLIGVIEKYLSCYFR